MKSSTVYQIVLIAIISGLVAWGIKIFVSQTIDAINASASESRALEMAKPVTTQTLLIDGDTWKCLYRRKRILGCSITES